MSEKIRLMLVDDQRLMRDGLRTILELEPDLTVAAEAENGRQAVETYGEIQPDVVLMDIRMPEMDGVEATRQLVGQNPKALIIILTTFDDDQYVFEGLRAGAMGYLLKDVSGIAPAAKGSAESLVEPLSEREEEVLRLLAQGLTNREIAHRAHLAEGTVKNYVSAILTKIGARDRTQAALRAKELGLLD